ISGWVCLEAIGIEPLLPGVRSTRVRIAQQVWTVAGNQRGVIAETGRVEARRDGAERQAAVVDDDARRLPATQNFTGETFLLLEERQLVDVVNRQHVGAIQSCALILVADAVGILGSVAAIVWTVCQIARPGIRR